MIELGCIAHKCSKCVISEVQLCYINLELWHMMRLRHLLYISVNVSALPVQNIERTYVEPQSDAHSTGEWRMRVRSVSV